MLDFSTRLDYNETLTKYKDDYALTVDLIDAYIRGLHQHQCLAADQFEKIDRLSDVAIEKIREIVKSDTVRVSKGDIDND